MRVFSFGGGVQSTAALVLAAQGKIDYKTFLFADTGDEHPDTYDYLNNVHIPYAETHGLEVLTLKRTWKDGSQYSILENIDRLETAIPIPVYLEGENRMPWRRHCTHDWKVDVIDKYLKKHGATEEEPIECGMGISVDEVQRATDSKVPFKVLAYPLLDLLLRRDDCQRLVKEAGLPPAPRSACYYCPYHSLEHWRDLKEEQPDLFARSLQLEEEMSARAMKHLGREASLSRKGKLADLPDQQRFAFDYDEPDTCDSGHCFT